MFQIKTKIHHLHFLHSSFNVFTGKQCAVLFHSVAILEFLTYNFGKKKKKIRCPQNTNSRSHTQTKHYDLIFARWQIVPQGSLAHTS